MHTKCTQKVEVILLVDARVSLNKYANRVLTVVKAKYELKDKSEALNKFVKLYGHNEVEPEVKEEYIKKILEIEQNYYKKHPNRRMNDEELDKLFGK
jgi:hypothetical protein